MTQSESPLAIGVDLGGTKVETALVGVKGDVVFSTRRPSRPEDGTDAVLATIVGSVREAYDQAGAARVAGVGVGVAGQIDPATGMVWTAPNLHWREVPLRARLEEALRVPVAVLNDVQSATYAEWTFGAGRGAADLLCLFVGTGVGGGIVAQGQLVRGCGGSAGELGHTVVDLNGRPCRCGNRGCLEAYAGGWAIAERARAALASRPDARDSLLYAGAQAAGDEVTARTVGEAFRAGDPLAGEIVRETGAALGAAVASFLNAFNPCMVILGGGVIEGITKLVERINAEVAARSLPAARACARIVRAQLGLHAGAIGAASWARLHAAAADPEKPAA